MKIRTSKFNIMKEAYLTTISDFEIELRTTKWWRFKRISYLQRKIKYYEELLNAL